MATAAPVHPSLPPGPPAREGLASSLRYAARFFFDPFTFVGGRFERYGDIYYAPAKGVGLFVLRRPDHIREVLVTQADAFEKTHTAFERLSTVLGQGLLTTDGDVWRRHRRLLAPAFSRSAIESNVDRMTREAEVSRDKLLGAGDKPVNVAPEMVDLTLRVVGRTLLGIDLADEVDLVGRSMRTLQLALAVPPSLPGPVRWVAQREVERAVAGLDGVIERIIAARRARPEKGSDLLQLLLDAVDPEDERVRLSAREIRDELVTFLLAGHETTSNTLAWAIWLISQSPDVERELLGELDRVLGGRPVGEADVAQLTYTEQIVKESMRLYPPAYILARRAATDVRLGDYDVPRGSEVVVWIYFTHHDARLYPDPEVFRPERFTKEAEAARHKQAYLPFGAGPRACIGRSFALVEAVVALATLYQRAVFRFAGSSPPRPRPRLTLSPSGGLPMRVVRRT
ncbi:MAG: cytochrome P450 [Polyangiaceae bacterium]